jgi:hypothetical protein
VDTLRIRSHRAAILRRVLEPPASSQENWKELMIEGEKLRDQARYADAENWLRGAVRVSNKIQGKTKGISGLD